MSHKKFGPDRFSRFDVYWIQTNKQTNKQTSQIYIQINRPITVEQSEYKVSDWETEIHRESEELRNQEDEEEEPDWEPDEEHLQGQYPPPLNQGDEEEEPDWKPDEEQIQGQHPPPSTRRMRRRNQTGNLIKNIYKVSIPLPSLVTRSTRMNQMKNYLQGFFSSSGALVPIVYNLVSKGAFFVTTGLWSSYGKTFFHRLQVSCIHTDSLLCIYRR